MTPAEILAEEQARSFAAFDYATAWQLGAAMREIAARDNLPVAIEVTHGTTPVFFALMPGATPDNPDWTRRKRATALRFHRSSLYMRLLCEAEGVDFNARYRLPPADFVASGGAVPILVQGSGVVGCAAVSGLPDVADHRLVLRGLTACIELAQAR